MGNWAKDGNLIRHRPNIMTLFGVQSWEETIEARWYRTAAVERGIDWRETPFDPEKIPDSALPSAEACETQLSDLAAYKTLELIYASQSPETPEANAFERLRDHFSKRYSQELKEVLEAGIDYDWSGGGSVAADEKAGRVFRRLYRV